MITRVALGTVFMVATLMIVSFTAIDEPARMAQFESGYHGRSVEAGAALYANNCATCHGPDGKGIAGRAPAINAADLYNGTRFKEIGWSGTTHDYVHGAIAGGRPRASAAFADYPQRMPTWSREFGGPLRPDQVNNIVDFVMNWEETALLEVVAEKPSDFVAVGLDLKDPVLPKGDVAHGEKLTQTYGCVACHMNPDMNVAPGPGWPAKYYSGGVSIAERAATRFTAADYTGNATSAEEYLRESILQTNVYVVPPYVANIMPKIYGEQMAAKDLADVIAYLQTIK